jgi:Uma2 family endonuclease
MGQVKTLMTAEQIPLAAATRRTELIRGELTEMTPVGRLHSRIVGRMLGWLEPFVTRAKLGEAGSEMGFILSRDPDTVRAPDVHFVAASRLATAGEVFIQGAPDLAVEVLSPEDRASEIQGKVREYLSAGSHQVWVVDPHHQTVAVYRPSGDAHIYAGDDEVSASDLLPGFSFRCADLFHWD